MELKADRSNSAESSAESVQLSKQGILQANDIPIECVDMRPFGWPGHVHVCGLSAAGRDAWETSLFTFDSKNPRKTKPNLHNTRAKLLQRCLCNEQRVLLFEEEEIEALGRKSGRALDHLYDVAKRLSGIGDEDVKELVKNSEPTQSESFSTV